MADAPTFVAQPASPVLHTTVSHGRADRSYRQMRTRVDSPTGDGSSARALRVAPLLVVAGRKGVRTVVVGSVCLVVSDLRNVDVQVAVSGAWAEQGAHGTTDWMHEFGSRAESTALVEHFIASTLAELVDSEASASDEGLVAVLAKTLCESARNSLAELREMRYELEQQLALTSSADGSSLDHTMVVSFLLQLNVMLGRVADEAREAHREGLGAFLTDDEAYHAYRKLRDPLLITPYPAATRELRPWMQQHDAAMRQCEAMSRQIEGDARAIRSLVQCAASISSSREADAQSRFNVLAAIASVGLGLPALVLALYGTSILLPLNTRPRLLAFLPVVVSLAIAAGIATWQGHRIKRGRVWTLGAVGILLVLLLLLLVAGQLAPMLP